MNPSVRILLLLFCLTQIVSPALAQKYRWDTKILIDTAGVRVFGLNSQPSSVDELTNSQSNPRPQRQEMQHGLRAAAEKRTVTLSAVVVQEGREDDGDYHLVLKSPATGKTLIGEIPDPTQSKLKGFPVLRKHYAEGRDFVQQNLDSSPGKIKPVPQPLRVKVTGVVFFDKIAHGNGHAPNGVELHPILDITKD